MHLWNVSARSRRLYLAFSLRTSRRGLSAQCVSRPKYTRHFSGLIFAPVGHRLNVLVRRRAPAALSIACPLSCCIWPIMDHVAVWCVFPPMDLQIRALLYSRNPRHETRNEKREQRTKRGIRPCNHPVQPKPNPTTWL